MTAARSRTGGGRPGDDIVVATGLTDEQRAMVAANTGLIGFDVRQAVAQAIHGAACGCHAEDVADSFPNPADAVVSASYGDQADAVLSVPAVAEVFALVAEIRRIVAESDKLVLDRAIGLGRIAALFDGGDRP